MTDIDTDQLRASWHRIQAYGDNVALRFYELLFMVHPELERMFPVGMAEQRGKFVATLATIMGKVDKVTEAVPFLYRLGARHHGAGVRAEHYPIVGQALLATFARFDPEWTDELRHHWGMAYGVIGQAMQQGAELAVRKGPQFTLAAVMKTGGDPAQALLVVRPHLEIVIEDGLVMASARNRPGYWRTYTAEPVLATGDRFDVRLIVPVVDVPSMYLAQLKPGDTVGLSPAADESDTTR